MTQEPGQPIGHSFFQAGPIIDADGTVCEADGECKQGMNISYDGRWGYHPVGAFTLGQAHGRSFALVSGNRVTARLTKARAA